jgi:uncharacterized NAD(P)/FAD-binding protein YdhS
MRMTTRDLVVVGGGAAGAMLVAHLAQAVSGAVRVALVDAGPGRPGAGTAYRTTDPAHYLNVRARSLSAWHDSPDHFVGWLAGVADPAGRDDFARRSTYGAYLAAVAYDAGNGPHAHVDHVRDRVVDVRRHGSRWRVGLAGGDGLDAARVVLATGVTPPSTRWAAGRVLAHDRFIADPWRPGALDPIGPRDRVRLVGTGLTAVDVALTLDAPDRPIVMVSRHGLLPTAHVQPPRAPLPVDGDLPTTLAGARRLVRALVAASVAASGDWRPAIDGLRPYTAGIWSLFSDADRAEFVARHARRWEVARHRMAPAVAARIAAMRADGRLTVRAGAAPDEVAPGEWVVNATGPDPDARRADPLLRTLIARGTAAPGPIGLGLATDADGRLLDASGAVVPGLYTLGATRRGQLWESTAVPELRAQAYALAMMLADRSRVAVAA